MVTTSPEFWLSQYPCDQLQCPMTTWPPLVTLSSGFLRKSMRKPVGNVTIYWGKSPVPVHPLPALHLWQPLTHPCAPFPSLASLHPRTPSDSHSASLTPSLSFPYIRALSPTFVMFPSHPFVNSSTWQPLHTYLSICLQAIWDLQCPASFPVTRLWDIGRKLSCLTVGFS